MFSKKSVFFFFCFFFFCFFSDLDVQSRFFHLFDFYKGTNFYDILVHYENTLTAS